MKARDVTGEKFGKLTALKPTREKADCKWICKCDCGRITQVRIYDLLTENTKSCGCSMREFVAAAKTIHGQSMKRTGERASPEYTAYNNAKQRCTDKQVHNYGCYGGRNIEFRFHSFQEFFAEIGPRPSSRHSLDRIDVNGHYESGNVRWATILEQRHNRR